MAATKLQAYLEWRKRYNLDDVEETTKPASTTSTTTDGEDSDAIISKDELNWDAAATAAMAASGAFENSVYPKLPRLARFDDIAGNDAMLGKDGNRIMQINPPMLDNTLASEETYVLCIAFYLERNLSRTSREQITLCVDVRGGDGWACPPVKSIMSFIKDLITTVDLHFPDRLAMSIVYPLPFAGIAIWSMIKPFLDKRTVQKVAILKGACHRDSPIPYDKMVQYIEKDVLDQMEKNRISTIVPEKKK